MRNVLIGIVVGIVLGVGLLYSVLYVQTLNGRVTNIEKYLIQAQQKTQPQAVKE